MTTPSIKIDQTPLVAGTPGSSREDLVLGVPVVGTDSANGAGIYAWELVVPPGSSATLSGGSTDTCQFTPDVRGTYLLYLVFDGLASYTLDADLNEISTQGGAAVKYRQGTRALGVGETFQFALINGWAEDFAPYFATIDSVTPMAGAAEGSLHTSDADGDVTPLGQGTATYLLQSAGPGAPPTWLNPTALGLSLQTSYNNGSSIDTDAGSAVSMSRTANNTGNVLELTKAPGSAFAGSALAITMGSQTTGPAIAITNSGNNADILWGTSRLQGGSLFLQEKGAAIADIAGLGQLWTKAADELWFTGPGGIDVQLGVGGSEGTVTLLGNTSHVQQNFNDFYDGALMEAADVDVTSDGATITLSVELVGGGDLSVRINSKVVLWDTTPVDTVALTAGTDTVPQVNYVFATEAGDVVTLTANTSGWPLTEHAPIATVYCQSAASLQTDGPFKVHAYTDHLHNGAHGHLSEINLWIRQQSATWTSGVAPGDMALSSPNAYLSVAAGSVFQLHEHSFPARDMQTGDPAWVVNDPTTSFLRITSLDDLTQLSDASSINNRWFSLVLWGSVNEDSTDCKIFINLPSGSYSGQTAAENDVNGYTDFSIPAEFKGAGFLIARYNVQGKTSGLWVQGSKVDLRGLFPASSPGASGGVTDHDTLSNLGTTTHTAYSLVDGSRLITGPQAWDSGGASDPNLRASTVDPSAGGGVAAPEGSLLMRFAAGAGEVWFKDGATDIDWTQVGAGGSHPDPHALALGSEAAPAYAFSGDVDTGAWSPGANIYAISTGATEATRWNASQQTLVPDGSVSAPSYSFADTPGMGMYSDGSALYLTSNGSSKWLKIAGANGDVMTIRPDVNVSRACGSQGRSWAQVYSRVVVFPEVASRPIGPVGSYAMMWVKNTTPNALWFTDDLDIDHQLPYAPLANTSAIATNAVERQRWSANTTGLPVSTITRLAVSNETPDDDLDVAGLLFVNSTAAVADVGANDGQQYAPAILHEGQAWKSDAAAETRWIRCSTQLETRQGTASPFGRLVTSFAREGIASGAFIEAMSLDTAQNTNLVALHVGAGYTTAQVWLGTDSSRIQGAGADVGIYGGSAESGRFDDDATAGNTRFMLYDVDNGTLERVTVGAADSGGGGFKVLRIPN